MTMLTIKYTSLLCIWTVAQSIHAASGESHDKRGNDKALYEAPSWELTNVTRRIPSDGEIWMRFDISSPNLDPMYCYMLVHVNGDARHASFSDQRCVGSSFTMSWGYARDDDAGIMTIVNPGRTRRCWFGWRGVNAKEHLEDAGPNNTAEMPPM
ncbi:uncharacterized protein G6M90_00g108190 [Metarhizium brunneum]|uniref:Uncharacterized protein n=1 Tax=Metarhizium brunneum TaxID=500148 RepID=A0A7D5Z040_9HYPO|nr:hypothetical protein G6M90_00g108190 [Metarhizium brunneum]